VTPTLAFTIRIAELTGANVHAIALRCQIRIEPRRRRYTDTETDRLVDLFGEASRWTETLQPMQLATVSAWCPGSPARPARSFGAVQLRPGDRVDAVLPRARGRNGGAAVAGSAAQCSSRTAADTRSSSCRGRRSRGTACRWLLWRDMVERDFPNSGWLRCSRETLEALAATAPGTRCPTWEHTIRSLLSNRRLSAPRTSPPDLGVVVAFMWATARFVPKT
jgi:hypothetical protein